MWVDTLQSVAEYSLFTKSDMSGCSLAFSAYQFKYYE